MCDICEKCSLEKSLQFTYILFDIILMNMMRKKFIIEKMHLTQCSGAVHQIFTSNYQENPFQCKSFNQKSFCKKVKNSERRIMKTPEKIQRNPREICKLDKVRT